MSEQTIFPGRIRFLDGTLAQCLAAVEQPDLSHDIGACCWLSRRPRYQVNGVEAPDFDPTIPADLYAAGWRWWGGGWLTCDELVLTVVHFADLDELWAKAREFNLHEPLTLELPIEQLSFL